MNNPESLIDCVADAIEAACAKDAENYIDAAHMYVAAAKAAIAAMEDSTISNDVGEGKIPVKSSTNTTSTLDLIMEAKLLEWYSSLHGDDKLGWYDIAPSEAWRAGWHAAILQRIKTEIEGATPAREIREEWVFGVPYFHPNKQLRDDLEHVFKDCQGFTIDILINDIQKTIEKHGYGVKIYKRNQIEDGGSNG